MKNKPEDVRLKLPACEKPIEITEKVESISILKKRRFVLKPGIAGEREQWQMLAGIIFSFR